MAGTVAQRYLCLSEPARWLLMLLLFVPMALPAGELSQGYKAFEKGQFEDAARNFEDHAQKEPTDFDQLYNAGVALFKKGDSAEAIKYFDRAKQSADPQLKGRSAYNKGVALAQQKNWEQAAAEFQEALSYDNDNPMIRENLEFSRLQKNPKQDQPQDQQKSAEDKSAEQKSAEQKSAEQKSAEQKSAEQKSAEQKSAEQKSAEQKSAEQKSAEQKSAEQKSAEQKSAEQKSAEQKSAEQKSAEQKSAEQKSAEQKSAEQKSAEQKSAEQKSAEQKSAEQKSAEQKSVEQKSAEQKSAEQKSAEQKSAEQKSAEQKSGEQKSQDLQQTSDGTANGANEGKNQALTLKDLKKQEAEKLLRSVEDRIGTYILTPEQANTEGKSSNGKDW